MRSKNSARTRTQRCAIPGTRRCASSQLTGIVRMTVSTWCAAQGPDRQFNSEDDLSVYLEDRSGSVVSHEIQPGQNGSFNLKIEHDRGPFNGRAEVTGTVTDQRGRLSREPPSLSARSPTMKPAGPRRWRRQFQLRRPSSRTLRSPNPFSWIRGSLPPLRPATTRSRNDLGCACSR